MTESTDSIHQIPVATYTCKQRLDLQTQVQADFFAALEAELCSLICDRLLVCRKRIFTDTIQLLRARLAKYASAIGLCLSVVLISLDGSTMHGIRVDLLLFFLFSVAFFATWDTDRLLKTQEKIILPYWRRIANLSAAKILKAPKKVLPFTAEYQFRDDVVSCYRINTNGTRLAWSKTLEGWYFSGQHVTMLFKKKTSIHPYLLIMHEAPQELALYLDALSLHCIDSIQAT
jgi:hypothetical protein